MLKRPLASIVLIASVAVLLSGCQAFTEFRQNNQKKSAQRLELKRQAQKRLDDSIPICSDEADCKVKWEAAQLWVVKNAHMKIQTATNVLIETYGSAKNSPRLAVRVTKEPAGSRQYKLLVNVWCGASWGCGADPMVLAQDFNNKVGAAAP